MEKSKAIKSWSAEEQALWDRVKKCDKCRDIATVRDARSGDVLVNGCKLNIENPLSSVNKKCLGKFVGEGPENSIMFIGMNPGHMREKGDRTLRGIWPTAGAKLRILLQHFGKDWDDFYLTNLVKCSTHDDNLPPEVINNCLHWLQEEIRIKKVNKIVLLGDKVIDKFSDLLKVNLSVRLEPYQLSLGNNMITVFAMPHPGAHAHQVSREKMLSYLKHVLEK